MARMFRSAVMVAALVASTAAVAQIKRPAPLQPDTYAGDVAASRHAILDRITPVTDSMLRHPSASEWLQWRRTYDEQGYSPLTEINRKSVARLRPAWAWTLPVGTSELAPLVHDGVMFVYGRGDHIQALNAATGDLLWEYVYLPPSKDLWPGAAGTYRKNFALYGDKLYFPTSDSHEIALNIHTGAVAWDHKLTDISLPYRASSGALAVDGKVLQGMTNCSRLEPGGCVIIALDANTGDEVWRFHTIPRPGEPGDESWGGLPLEKRQGASIWTTPSYDPDLNLAFFGTGNSYDWQDMVQGDTSRSHSKDGLYTDSTLAINPDSGKLIWYYQHLPQDIWDLDFAFDRQIVTLSGRKLVVTTGKTMITDGLDAATGKWVFSKDEGLQNIVQSINPLTGEKTYNPEALFDISGGHTSLQCPMDNGGKDWPSNGYDPSSHTLFMTMAEDCTEVLPRRFTASDPYTGGGQEISATRYRKDSDGKIGRFEAIDLATRKTKWTVRQRAPFTTSALVTAGGLVFVGDSDRVFHAFDVATGKEVWRMRLNDVLSAFPISFSVGGKQYIAVSTGGGGPQIGSYHQLTPEIHVPTGNGAAMWVFELARK